MNCSGYWQALLDRYENYLCQKRAKQAYRKLEGA